MARRWPCRSGSSIIYIGMQEWLLIACRSGSSLAMQEWLVVDRAGVARRWPCRSGSSNIYIGMQEWLVVGHAGVARLLYI